MQTDLLESVQAARQADNIDYKVRQQEFEFATILSVVNRVFEIPCLKPLHV